MGREMGRGWLLGAALLAAAAHVSGQTAAPARQDDVLPALLAEVKGLRAALEQMASAGPRVQLFASRLQLQEGRMNAMARRLDTVRDSLAGAQREVVNLQNEERRFEVAVSEGRNATTPEAREDVRQAEFAMAQLRRQIAVAKTTVDRHAAEESQLLADLSTEQGRWLAINQQLDELEKALAKR